MLLIKEIELLEMETGINILDMDLEQFIELLQSTFPEEFIIKNKGE